MLNDIFKKCLSLFGWKENFIFKETATFKLEIWDFQVILTDFEYSKNLSLVLENEKRNKF